MQAWQYKLIQRTEHELLTEEQLNQLGDAGFELVGLLSIADQVKIVGRVETQTMVRYFFKRPKPAAKSQPAAQA